MYADDAAVGLVGDGFDEAVGGSGGAGIAVGCHGYLGADGVDAGFAGLSLGHAGGKGFGTGVDDRRNFRQVDTFASGENCRLGFGHMGEHGMSRGAVAYGIDAFGGAEVAVGDDAAASVELYPGGLVAVGNYGPASYGHEHARRIDTQLFATAFVMHTARAVFGRLDGSHFGGSYGLDAPTLKQGAQAPRYIGIECGEYLGEVFYNSHLRAKIGVGRC